MAMNCKALHSEPANDMTSVCHRHRLGRLARLRPWQRQGPGDPRLRIGICFAVSFASPGKTDGGPSNTDNHPSTINRWMVNPEDAGTTQVDERQERQGKERKRFDPPSVIDPAFLARLTGPGFAGSVGLIAYLTCLLGFGQTMITSLSGIHGCFRSHRTESTQTSVRRAGFLLRAAPSDADWPPSPMDWRRMVKCR